LRRQTPFEVESVRDGPLSALKVDEKVLLVCRKESGSVTLAWDRGDSTEAAGVSGRDCDRGEQKEAVGGRWGTAQSTEAAAGVSGRDCDTVDSWVFLKIAKGASVSFKTSFARETSQPW